MTQSPRVSLGFDERNRFLFCHRLAAVLAERPRQRRRQLEANDSAFPYDCRIHEISVGKEADPYK